MTVAPSHTTMKNFHSRNRPLTQPLFSLYREPPESSLLYAPCSLSFSLCVCVFCKRNVLHFLVFRSALLGTESQKCAAACSTGTVAQWAILAPWRSGPVGTFYNLLEVSSSPPTFFCIEEGMLALLKPCVSGARCRSPEGSL